MLRGGGAGDSPHRGAPDVWGEVTTPGKNVAVPTEVHLRRPRTVLQSSGIYVASRIMPLTVL